jgi:hypothetical protein
LPGGTSRPCSSRPFQVKSATACPLSSIRTLPPAARTSSPASLRISSRQKALPKSPKAAARWCDRTV